MLYMLYMLYIILKLFILAIVRKTTKLIKGGHRCLQDYRHIYICYYFYVFLRFFKIHVFCRASYVFSNYELRTTDEDVLVYDF